MVKRIIWSIRAKEEKKSILLYWRRKNKSNVYPRKLNTLFNNAIRGLAISQIPRKKADYGDAFVKLVRDYLIIFQEDENTIYILSIWDTRQNPQKLKDLLQ